MMKLLHLLDSSHLEEEVGTLAPRRRDYTQAVEMMEAAVELLWRRMEQQLDYSTDVQWSVVHLAAEYVETEIEYPVV